MKKSLLPLWLLVPVAVLARHYGSGQRYLARDCAAELIVEAEAATGQEDWQRAAMLYAEAAKLLPEGDRADRDRLDVAHASVRMAARQTTEELEQVRFTRPEVPVPAADLPAVADRWLAPANHN